jgi:uncharacterized protein (TIGR00255 family)
MIRSMTGYGRAQFTTDGKDILVEIKSVNHRYFDFSSRIPRMYGFLDEKLKTYLGTYISRGKVDAFVTIDIVEGNDNEVLLNHQLAGSYITALRELKDKYSLRDDISVSTVSRYSEIFTVRKSPENEESIWQAVKKVADVALESFVKMRESEGERLKQDIRERAKAIREAVELVEKQSPQTVEDYRTKIKNKMVELLGETGIDENRILMEAAMFADKIAVDEETVRLKSHLIHMEEMFAVNEPIGRKLDFLMQEMNREANTIGSKAIDVNIAKIVVNIKSELEKIREQIQNLE